MTYRPKYDPATKAVHEAMPPAASEPLTLALADTCHEALGATQPDSEDDGVVRLIVTEQAFAVPLLGNTLKTITVPQINNLG
ncbi:hypothetical protein [Streptomyces sp. NPDC003483]